MQTRKELIVMLSRAAAAHRVLLLSLIVISALPATAQTWTSDSLKVIVGGAALSQIAVSSLTPQNKLNAALPEAVVQGSPVPGSSAGIWPSLSPDNSILAYLGDGTKLTTLDRTTQQSKMLDDHAASPIAWSPDSKFLAYVRTDEKGGLEYRSLHANGDLAVSAALPFTKVAAGTMQTISWVPTTDNAIVAGGDGVKTDLYLIDQGQVVQLTSSGDVLGFAVSSNGERVRWVRRSPNTHYILLSVYDLIISKRTALKLDFPDRLPGTNPQPRRAVDAVTSVVFSPDLNRMAFVTRGGPGSDANGTALYLCDVHGKNIHLIGKGKTSGPPVSLAKPDDNGQPPAPPAVPGQVAPGAQSTAIPASEMTGLTFPALLPVFSPDSKQLAALSLEGDKRSLILYNVVTNARSVGALP